MTTYSLKELEQYNSLQMSYYELQSRVAKMAAVNPAWASRSGKRGAWLVTEAGLNVLLRIRELEQSGASVDTALATITEEMAKRAGVDQEHLGNLYDETHQMLLERIEEYRHQIQELKEERERLWRLIENLAPALKPPAEEPHTRSRRWWWPFHR